ncbi:S24 family peptidase [Aureimonas populi]|uniref:S24 family peptidase n=1 Tax=Aureimonas populi TaxID=1701758 RepID=A0ABW5CHD8_9HYPH|nr:S24 family peptidase [Aureimonas populi]
MELFPVTLPADTFRSTKLRLEPVRGDGMEPTLRGGRDFVLIKPTHTYEGEAIYLIDLDGDGEHVGLRRCDRMLGRSNGGAIRLMLDNPVYGRSGPTVVSREVFDGAVLGIVVADVKVRADHVLHDVLEGRAA